LYYSELETKSHLIIPIGKVLSNLRDVISENSVDDRLIHSYDKIFLQCDEQLVMGNKEIDNLVSVFKNITLQYDDVSDLMESFLDIKII
jgi:hypothetical protein